MNESPHRGSKYPLEGKTLHMILTELYEHFGWDGLARQLPINSFIDNPSIKSSLSFLRRTPWARGKIEKIYRSFLQGKVQQAGDDSES